MRLNGESTQNDNRQSGVKGSLVHSVPFSSTLSKPATQGQPNEELHALETPHHQQNSPVSVPEQEKETVKEEKESPLSIQEETSKEDISSTQSESESEGYFNYIFFSFKRSHIIRKHIFIIKQLTISSQVPTEHH